MPAAYCWLYGADLFVCITCEQGCEFDVLLGRCDNTTNAAGVTTAVSYCASNDTVCASCSVSSSRPVCMGQDGRCICQTLCFVMPTVRSSCKKEMPIATVWLGFGLFAFALPFLLYLQRKCNEPHGGIQHMMYNRRRRRRQRKRHERDTTRDLTLAEWRDHCELHKLELGDVELKTCYLLLQDAKLPPVVQPERSLATSGGDEQAADDGERQNTGREELEMVAPTRVVSEQFDDQEESKRDDDEGADASDREHVVSVAVDNWR